MASGFFLRMPPFHLYQCLSRRALARVLACLPLSAALLNRRAVADDANGIQSDAVDELITRLVIDNVPREYEDKKKWGKTRKVMNGLKVETEGMKVETRRTFTEVNHGSWQMYRLTLVDPERQLRVRLADFRDAGEGLLAFSLSVDVKLDAFGRFSEWRRGLQLWSISVEADALARFHGTCELTIGLDPTTFPPDAIFAPKVKTADLQLAEFHLRRVSHAKGPLIKQMSGAVRQMVEDRLRERREKLVEKVNRQLAKNQDKFRLSLAKLATSKWNAWLTPDARSSEK